MTHQFKFNEARKLLAHVCFGLHVDPLQARPSLFCYEENKHDITLSWASKWKQERKLELYGASLILMYKK